MLVKKCSVKVGNLHCKALALTPAGEHICVGGYAAAEVMGLHFLMYYFSLALAITVAGSIIYNLLKGDDNVQAD